MIERYGGNVRAMVISQTTSAHLEARIKTNVEKGATVYTDAHRGYYGLDSDYVH